jgi:hypothetical protein
MTWAQYCSQKRSTWSLGDVIAALGQDLPPVRFERIGPGLTRSAEVVAHYDFASHSLCEPGGRILWALDAPANKPTAFPQAHTCTVVGNHYPTTSDPEKRLRLNWGHVEDADEVPLLWMQATPPPGAVFGLSELDLPRPATISLAPARDS